ncbi:tRNA preQ1(34) S-adenosylmethionine ribosyltransferase-isomerase QueA [Pelagibacterium xiamenense]|uniref:tRNA preQ1(34) S-adenosylmethionine ribosyltransferase-isomerase QueA n=1 Tax=Pelagibacterium xiamenense TaxID=2901140 RepID=UPI001E35209D|nr:tRNA preQ1(34) S-adenosylmethionine ribosyltransferase-isomerase QueA [Pelagibacterium xiamenense]MCD7060972.1 tRNA preQ1(34) S-adenosylmethionine ribosyltransferase-isomerase QueA [Pelagibacterium xiamenense]
MKVDLFDFELPDDRIALHPVSPRDSAKMLVVASDGTLTDRVVTDLAGILRAGDVLVVNDTRVIPADLKGVRHRGEYAANVSFNLHKRENGNTWRAFARPAKRLKEGDRVVFGATSEVCLLDELSATVKVVSDGEVTLAFDFSDAVLDEAIKARGAMPLPPYIGAKRGIEARDAEDYQTVYAEHDGAVAAPTAGLHFTEELLARLEELGVTIEHVTLHVGAGTFLPMKADDTEDHKMHAEWGVVSPETVARIEKAKADGGRVVAVGTTSLRLLESAARETGALQAFAGDTDIFITPGFDFRVVDVLMTNFHLPRSTLFMLVSAFSGLETMHKAYKHAIENAYRFYSYGDSSLLFRATND